MSTPELTLPPGFNGQVRLFPLPNLVMFPSNVLPLHIFESRYREMLEDALNDDQLITIATLTPGFDHDYYSRPPISPVVCIGRVISHQRNEKGTYDLILLGLQRAQIEHEIEPVRSFRRAAVTLIGEPLPDADESLSQLAQQLAERVQQTLPAAHNLVEEFRQHHISLASLTDILAFHLPLPLDLKLQLLGEADVVKRATCLLTSLPTTPAAHRRTRRYTGDTDFSPN